jgi:hypothetical protein
MKGAYTMCNATTTHLFFLIAPFAVLIISMLLSGLESRMDDYVYIAIQLVFTLSAFFFILVRSKVPRFFIHSFLILIGLMCLILFSQILVFNTPNSYAYSAYLLALMLAPVLSKAEGFSTRFTLLGAVKFSLIAYYFLVLIIYAYVHFDNEAFMKHTSINIGSILLPSFVLLAFVTLHQKSGRKKNYFIYLLFFSIIIISGNKLSMLIGLMLIFYILNIKNLVFFIFLALFVIFLAVQIDFFESEKYSQVLYLFSGDFELIGSLVNRLYLYDLYFDLALDNLLHGYGFGSLEDAYNQKAVYVENMSNNTQFSTQFHTPHNSYLRLMVEGGFILLSCILLYQFTIFNSVIKGKSGKYRQYLLLLISLIFLNSFITESLYSWVFWVSMAQLHLLFKTQSFSIYKNYK